LPEAKREWNRVVPQLERLGLLTVVDRAALAGYCQSWARYREAEEAISQDGLIRTTESGYSMPHPAVSISRNALQQVRAFCAEFGLTPSSRGRIQMPGAEDEDTGVLD
jgi:P27 family predicted phage terminase small subunit